MYPLFFSFRPKNKEYCKQPYETRNKSCFKSLHSKDLFRDKILGIWKYYRVLQSII